MAAAGPARGSDGGGEPRRLSIVVETWNEDHADGIGLRASLEALARQSIPIEGCEVLVVLSQSRKGLADVVRSVLPHARLLIPDRELGYGQMKMHGALASACELVAFTDADCPVEAGWVAAVLDGFRDAPPTVAALQGLTRHARAPGWQAATLLYCRAMWSPVRRGRYLVLNNFAIRRAMFERYPFADVPVRQNVERLMITPLLRAGYEIRIEPQMRATHAYRPGLRSWFHRGRAEAFDRLETLRRVHVLTEPPERVAYDCRLRRRLGHHTRRCAETLRDLVRCRAELEIGPSELLLSGLAAVTIWAGACLGAWQARRGGPRPATDF
jgi:hypothetical protein